MNKRIPEHKNHTKTFDELDYAEQAKSITAQINVLEKAILAHVREAHKKKVDSNRQTTLLKCIGQASRMIDRIAKKSI